jgi:hypothetical protein
VRKNVYKDKEYKGTQIIQNEDREREKGTNKKQKM